MGFSISRFIERQVTKLLTLPRVAKRAITLAADLTFIPLALWAAIVLKLGRLPEGLAATPWPYLIAVLVSIPVFVRLGLYRAVLRYIGARVIGAVFAGVTASTLFLLLINALAGAGHIPVTAVMMYWVLAMVYVGGSRILVRSVLTARRTGSERVVIYGAGAAGAQVAHALRTGGHFDPVAFVDDDPALAGSNVAGIDVYLPAALPELIAEDDARVVLLALPSQSRQRRSQILVSLEALPVRVMTLPEIGALVSGTVRVEDVRDVDVGDLLGRDSVPPNEELYDACIRGKSVLVTGAGGSIGSELCRQIIQRGPRCLVLFEMSELALYRIEMELREQAKQRKIKLELVALLGNAHHRRRIDDVIRAFQVQTIYHAAAYKHVPIVEQNLIEGVHNNVLSTWHAAEAALANRVETFVLISTDKAVNPTNMMGATKRLAEMLIQALQSRTEHTRFCMVRFGNVLGSSGSVVPHFLRQIRSGGPVTVTHPDVRRFFMTVAEAAQLVIQAGSMGKGADVFVLEMGELVRIDELARRMIRLSGMTVRDEANPQGDIEIQYVGLRPAEKLYEELLIGSNITGTEHPMILRAMEPAPTWGEIEALLGELKAALDTADCGRLIDLVGQAVSGYQRAPRIYDHVWTRRAAEPAPVDGNVTVLAEHRSTKPPSAAR